MAATSLLSDSLTHAGGGTALAVTYLGVLIPGFFPVLVLTVAVAVVLVVPFVALGAAAAVLAAPPYGLWLIATRTRRRGRRPHQPAGAPEVQPSPVPSPHAC